MEELMMEKASPTKYFNKDLELASAKIHKIGTKIKEGLFEVAAIIAEVDANASYQIDGFQSVHEWTEKEFGIKSSRSYALLTIGQKWTAPKLNAKDTVVGYTSAIDPRYSTTQTEKMLSTGLDRCMELHAEGVISPDMSAKKIGEILAELKKDPATEDPDLVEETDETPEETHAPEICIRVTDENGVEYEIPESVLYQYKI